MPPIGIPRTLQRNEALLKNYISNHGSSYIAVFRIWLSTIAFLFDDHVILYQRGRNF